MASPGISIDSLENICELEMTLGVQDVGLINQHWSCQYHGNYCHLRMIQGGSVTLQVVRGHNSDINVKCLAVEKSKEAYIGSMSSKNGSVHTSFRQYTILAWDQGHNTDTDSN
jgi:hypothetical protein